jgi:hypothetical protein
MRHRVANILKGGRVRACLTGNIRMDVIVVFTDFVFSAVLTALLAMTFHKSGHNWGFKASRSGFPASFQPWICLFLST